jgi:hypothetical protein
MADRFKLNPNKLKAEPEVRAAVALLQAHGWTVLREAPVEIGAEAAVTADEIHAASPADAEQAVRRVLRRRLEMRLGEQLMSRMDLKVTRLPEEESTTATARLYVVPVASNTLL